MNDPLNRIRDHLACACGSRIKPAAPSLGDKLLANGERLKLEIWKCRDGETELCYEIHGSISTGSGPDESADDDADGDGDTITTQEQHTPADLRRLASALLSTFTSTTKREGGAS